MKKIAVLLMTLVFTTNTFAFAGNFTEDISNLQLYLPVNDEEIVKMCRVPQSNSTENETLVEELKETNRILSEIKDELTGIAQDLKKFFQEKSQEKNLWNRVPSPSQPSQ